VSLQRGRNFSAALTRGTADMPDLRFRISASSRRIGVSAADFGDLIGSERGLSGSRKQSSSSCNDIVKPRPSQRVEPMRLMGLRCFKDARGLLDEAVEMIDRTGQRMDEAEVYRVLGELQEEQTTPELLAQKPAS
jgi:hypothetical protein